MYSRTLSVVAALALFLVGCTPPPTGPDGGPSDAGVDRTAAGAASEPDFVLDLEAATTLPELQALEREPHPLRANVPIPAPGDAGTCLCSNGVGETPSWCPCYPSTPVGLPDGGTGAMWYESDAGTVVALIACPNGDVIEWANGIPTCVAISDAGLVGLVLPDAGVGGIWYQGDAGVPDPVGLNCPTGDTIIWSGGVPVCAVYSDGGTVSGGTTLPDAGQGGMWMQDAGGGIPYAVPIGATDQVLTVVGAAPNWVTGIDSTGSLPIGGTSATAVTIGNATNTAGVSITAKTGNAISNVIGATVVNQQAQLSTDFSAYGASPASGGFIRVPSGAQTIIEGSAAILKTDSSNDTILNVAAGEQGLVTINGVTYEQLATTGVFFGASSTYTLGFQDTVTAAAIAYGAGASGAGGGIGITAQSAGGSANAGGGITLTSGQGTTTGASGNINLNVAAPAGTGNHAAVIVQEGQVGYLSVAPAYAASLAPAPAATVNPSTAHIFGSSPNGSCGSTATCTPGDVVIDLSAVGGSGSPTEPNFVVRRGNSLVFEASHYTFVGNYIGQWMGLGLTPSSTNYAFLGDGANVTALNNPTEVDLRIANATQLAVASGQVSAVGSFYWDSPGGTNTSQANVYIGKWYNVQTAATSNTTIATIAIPSSGQVTIKHAASSRLHATGTTGLGTCGAVNSFYNNAGTVTSAGTVSSQWAIGAAGCVFTISGTNVLVQVNNTSSSTIDVEDLVEYEGN